MGHEVSERALASYDSAVSPPDGSAGSPRGVGWRRWARVEVLLVAMSVTYCGVLVTDGWGNWGRKDWDQATFRYETPRTAILRDHQLPMWNPYADGGTVMWAHPHFPASSPWYLPVFILGAQHGLRFHWLMFITLGAVGMGVLLRRWGASTAGGVLGGVMFVMGSQFALRMAEGNFEWCHLTLMPWLVYLLDRAREDVRYAVGAALLYASILVFGSVYTIATFSPFISAIVVFEAIRRRQPRLLLGWGAVVAVAIAVASYQLLPQLELVGHLPRREVPPAGIEYEALLHMFLDPRQFEMYYGVHIPNTPPDLHQFLPVDIEQAIELTDMLVPLGIRHGWHEYGNYVTWLGLAVALFGLVAAFRERWPVFAAASVAFLLVLGYTAPIDVWSLLRQLPLYRGLSVPSRFLSAVGFTLAVAGGLGLTALVAALRQRGLTWSRYVGPAVVAVVYLELLILGWRFQSETFVLEPIEPPAHESFAQRYPSKTSGHFYYDIMYSSMLPYLETNSGMLDGYENVHVPKGKVKTVHHPDYRGEVFVESGRGSARIVDWTMAKVTVETDARGDDRLIMNQNYYVGWKFRRGDDDGVAEADDEGLISVPIPAGRSETELYYFPDSFVWGLMVTVPSLTACLAFLAWSTRKRRLAA